MCHADYADPAVRTSVRLAGLRGLNGVIRKTVNEDLAENIWDPRHMDKIVPSLLYNVESEGGAGGVGGGRETPDLGTSVDDETSPSRMADQILR